MGGYYLPFVVLGFLLFLTALLTLCILPKHPNEATNQTRGRKLINWKKSLMPNFYHYFNILIYNSINFSISTASLKTVLKIPGVLVCALSICATSASIGFLGATLEPHVRQFDLSPVLLGEFENNYRIFKYY